MILDHFRDCGSLDVFLVEHTRSDWSRESDVWFLLEAVEASAMVIARIERSRSTRDLIALVQDDHVTLRLTCVDESSAREAFETRKG